jgi:hypothetical protein
VLAAAWAALRAARVANLHHYGAAVTFGLAAAVAVAIAVVGVRR